MLYPSLWLAAGISEGLAHIRFCTLRVNVQIGSTRSHDECWPTLSSNNSASVMQTAAQAVRPSGTGQQSGWGRTK